MAVLKSGAATEVELKERKHRIEDAVRNAKTTVEEDIVPGDGVALLQASKAAKMEGLDDDEMVGANIVFAAAQAPLRQIVQLDCNILAQIDCLLSFTRISQERGR